MKIFTSKDLTAFHVVVKFSYLKNFEEIEIHCEKLSVRLLALEKVIEFF